MEKDLIFYSCPKDKTKSKGDAKMFTIEKTTAELEKRIDEAIAQGKNEITLTVKATGDKVTIEFCGYGELKSRADIDYYLVSCRFSWAGSDKLSKIATYLNRWEELIKEDKADKKELAAYKAKYCVNGVWAEDAFDFYSDWYKDLYGYRPRR